MASKEGNQENYDKIIKIQWKLSHKEHHGNFNVLLSRMIAGNELNDCNHLDLIAGNEPNTCQNQNPQLF